MHLAGCKALGGNSSDKRSYPAFCIIPTYAYYVACILQEAKHWEAAFQVYERGTALFKYPHVADIWTAYIKSFVAR
jgi:hypothetical protein